MQSERLARELGRATQRRLVKYSSLNQQDAARKIRLAVGRIANVAESEVPPMTEVRRTVKVLDGICIVELTFDSIGRKGIRAILLRRSNSPEILPAVLVSAGRHAVLDQVAGLAKPDYPDRAVAMHLARSGLATLTLDYGLDNEFTPEGFGAQRDSAMALASAFELSGRPLLGALVEENLAAVQWLRNQSYIDRNRIGLFGHSLGGAVALHTALLAEEPLPLCVAAHLGTYPVMYGTTYSGSPLTVLPGILEHADLPDLFAALAPQPIQVQYGLRDPNLVLDDTRAAAGRIREAWGQGASAASPPEVHELDIGHGTDLELAARFFRRSLTEERAPAPMPAVPPLRVRFDLEARREVTADVDECLASGVLTLGSLLPRFEAEAEPWLGREAVAVSSGSAALEIAYRMIGVAGRTVLVPVNTFFATAASAVRAGARVGFVDMELDGLGMDPKALVAALDEDSDVAAVVVVHIGGIVSPAVEDVCRICAERGIPVIEDAAHAFGSGLGGSPAGTFGRFGAFSLYPTKVLTSAEGGIVTAARPDDLALARRLRDHGKSAFESSLHDCEGGNWRLSEVHAAVGLAHLKRFGEMTAERRTLASRYDQALTENPVVSPYHVPKAVTPNGYKYLAYLPEGVARAELKQRLKSEHRVSLAGEVYERLLVDQPFFAGEHAGREFPNARWFARRHICLPLFPTMSHEQQLRTIEALRAELS
jgi:perosamine synthetase